MISFQTLRQPATLHLGFSTVCFELVLCTKLSVMLTRAQQRCCDAEDAEEPQTMQNAAADREGISSQYNSTAIITVLVSPLSNQLLPPLHWQWPRNPQSPARAKHSSHTPKSKDSLTCPPPILDLQPRAELLCHPGEHSETGHSHRKEQFLISDVLQVVCPLQTPHKPSTVVVQVSKTHTVKCCLCVTQPPPLLCLSFAKALGSKNWLSIKLQLKLQTHN